MFYCSLGHSFIHCSFIYLSIIWGHMVVPMIWLLWIRLLWLLGNKHQLCPCIQFLMVLYPRSEISGSHDKPVSSFEELILFGPLYPPYIPTRMPGGFSFSAPSQHPGSTLNGSRLCRWSGRMAFLIPRVSLFSSDLIWCYGKLWQRASPPVRFGNLFFWGIYSWEKVTSQRILRSKPTQILSPSYEPSPSGRHGKEKTLRNHLAHIPLMNCQLSCLRAGCLPCAFSWVSSLCI